MQGKPQCLHKSEQMGTIPLQLTVLLMFFSHG